MAYEIKAVIFDLDGVITDTAEYHYQAWKTLANELGIDFDRTFNEQLKGVSRMDSLERILALKGPEFTLAENEKQILATKKNDHYKQLISSLTPDDILPGILSLLKDIKAESLPIGLGSASKNAEEIIDRLELSSYFDYIVDAGKVKNGKPDPETFTVAADHFEVPYKQCIGIEDAKAGIEALQKADMFAVGVGDATSLGKADHRVDSTKELSFEKIKEAFAK